MTDFILIFLLILLVTRIFIKNKETLREFKKLNKSQLLGVFLTLIFDIIVVTTLIYYGRNWIMEQFTNIFLQALSFLVIVFLVLILIGKLSDKVVNKITNGILPKN
ncbi:hypothetical protein [Sporosarcina sp. P17b]|uniref:hypothetical protein n=1 Tax=Sporosarcina sp. P17b TaxID=2048260 RepID=UPI000C16A1D1|nr:hypothetical protein [Sporosarcina sp. P17b]PIC74484.1 hypothetical protein CSV76_04945 [Sporosarcina sp. P17b]